MRNSRAAFAALVVSSLCVVATPAQAAPPFGSNNFNPQNTALFTDFGPSAGGACTPGTGDPDCNVPDTLLLSDKFDGVDARAHITSVATIDATRAIYVICPPGGFPVGQTSVPPPGCDAIGVDDSGEPAAGFQVDEGYELFWDVPFNYDEVFRDFGSYHCTALPTNNEPGGNCDREIEQNVFIDDAQTGAGSSSAELFDYCINLNAAGDDDCTDAGDVAPRSFDHPGNLPNLTDGFTGAEVIVRARSSADVATLTLCIDFNADAQDPPNACNFQDNSGAVAAGAFNNHTFVVTYPPNLEMSWSLYDRSGGTGVCAGNDDDPSTGPDEGNACLLDNHYVVSSAPASAKITATFRSTAASSCLNPDKEETNSLVDTEAISVCLEDQFGSPMAAPITLQSTGVGHIGSCPGTRHDHNGDGLFEHCHSTTPSAGQLDGVLISNPQLDPGDQIIRVCSDPQNAQTIPSPGNPPPGGHGCADEVIVDVLTKHWQSLPQHVHLVFADTGDPADPCHTGDTFKENLQGDVDDLLACVFDNSAAHSPATTVQAGGGQLRWSIAPSRGGDLTATRFLSPPPSETGPDGHATAELESIGPGNDFIRVDLLSDSGAAISGASVQKRVVRDGSVGECFDDIDNDSDGDIDFPDDRGCASELDNSERFAHHARKVSINFDHASKPGGGRTLIVSGRVRVPGGFGRCRSEVTVNVERFIAGQGWATRKTDTAGHWGGYAVEIEDVTGTYRSRVARLEFRDQEDNVDICRRALNKRTHRH